MQQTIDMDDSRCSCCGTLHYRLPASFGDAEACSNEFFDSANQRGTFAAST